MVIRVLFVAMCSQLPGNVNVVFNDGSYLSLLDEHGHVEIQFVQRRGVSDVSDVNRWRNLGWDLTVEL